MRTYYDDKLPSYFRASQNTKYFARIECENCMKTTGLQKHKHNDDILCEDCIELINKQLREAEEYHGDLNELHQEREE